MKSLAAIALPAILSAFCLPQAASASHQPHITPIASFAGAGAGFTPLAGLAFGPDGTLYGTTTGGSTAGQ